MQEEGPQEEKEQQELKEEVTAATDRLRAQRPARGHQVRPPLHRWRLQTATTREHPWRLNRERA